MQRNLWTTRLSRRAQEKKEKTEKEMEAKYREARGGRRDSWECTWRIGERWTIYGMNNQKKRNRKCLV